MVNNIQQKTRISYLYEKHPKFFFKVCTSLVFKGGRNKMNFDDINRALNQTAKFYITNLILNPKTKRVKFTLPNVPYSAL